MSPEEREELMSNLDKLEDAMLAILRDIQNERNKIILEEGKEKSHE